MKIAIGSDHVGVNLKDKFKEYLIEKDISVKDFGTNSTDRMDYPLVARALTKAIQENECEKGILICGTGVGMAIAANKVNGIRAVVCSEPYSAQMSRAHNNTNVLALGARVVGFELARMIIDVWLETSYEGGRHEHRVLMMDELLIEC